MYVYFDMEPGLWTVGHFTPDGQFVTESDHESSEAAAQRVSYLNGNTGEIASLLEELKELRDNLNGLRESLKLSIESSK